MNFTALDGKARKALFKLTSEKEIRSIAKKDKNEKQYLLRFKKNIEKITVSELYKYFEENCLDQDDPIVEDVSKAICLKIVDKFEKAPKLGEIIDSKEFENLSDEQKEKLEEFREEYDEADMPISYEDFIKIHCIPDKQTQIKILIEKAVGSVNKEKEKIEAELEKTKKQLYDLKTDFNNLNSEKKKTDAKNKENEKQLERINKKFSLDNATKKINKLLKTNFEQSSYNELFNELDNLEKELLSKEKYSELLDVFAAKYAITKIQKEEK